MKGTRRKQGKERAYLATLDVQGLSSRKEEDKEESSMLEGDQERKIIIQECMREVGVEYRRRRAFKKARKWFFMIYYSMVLLKTMQITGISGFARALVCLASAEAMLVSKIMFREVSLPKRLPKL